MPSRVIGKNPKPAALIVGFDDAIADRIGRLFPARQVIDHLDEVEQKEWDVLVTTRSALGAEDHLYVIGLECAAYAPPGRSELPSTFGHYHLPSQPGHVTSVPVSWTGPSRARELHVATDLPSSIERLIVTQLVPLAEPEKLHQWLHPQDAMEPFLSTLLGQCLAGRFLRPGAKSECWCFPNYAVSIAPEIVEVALQEWRKRDPESFPVADWANKAMWRTPAENRVADELDKLGAKRATILAELEERQQQLEAEFADAKQSAETNERLLLTAQGDDLVNIVAGCLSELGFDVTKMDEIHTDERLEDLRVISPGQGWTALAEVKGYSGGAKSNDLLKFGRYWLRYFQEEGREPDTAWYIVNQFLENDPSTRRQILLGNEAALSTFDADYNGLSIDTANLFRLWMAVRDGRLPAEEARSSLIQASRRFAFDD
jgi:hypothetical protein